MATVYPESYGSCGSGSGDDSAVIQTALNTGKHVELDTTKSYRITSPLQMNHRHQAIVGGVLKPAGSFNAVQINGKFGVEVDLVMRCAGQTGGYAVAITPGSERCTVKKLLIEDGGFNGISVDGSNCINIDYFYAINLRGSRGIQWKGTDAQRSDILDIRDAYVNFISGVYNCVGLEWWGNAHSLNVDNMHVVGQAYGSSPVDHALMVWKTAGQVGGPQIGRFNCFSSDFTYNHGLIFYDVDDVDIYGLYQNGSQLGSGVWVNSTVAANSVRIHGGKAIGNAGCAVYAGAQTYVQGLRAYANSSGNTIGAISGGGVI